jgi:septation ring formation regulator EzrA
MASSYSSRDVLSRRIEMIEMHGHLQRELEHCKDAIDSLTSEQIDLKQERELLLGDQTDAEAKARLIVIESELTGVDRRMVIQGRRIEAINSKLAELRAMGIGP